MVVSVVCFIGAFYFARWGREQGRKTDGNESQSLSSAPGKAGGVGSTAKGTNSVAGASQSAVSALVTYRLSNTQAGVDHLARKGHAVLLENALFDTDQPLEVSIPQALRASGDPGSYIVQSQGRVDGAFRSALEAAGAKIISYIPNNAYLVRADAATAGELKAQAGVQSVIGYEPYYKLKPGLLKQVMENQPLDEGAELNVVVFVDAREQTVAALEKMGAVVEAQSPSPFGPVLRVKTRGAGLASVAGLSGVESVEAASARRSANDLSRVRIGVSTDTVVATNYLNLTGSNVVVAVADTGVDGKHPDLSPRVFGPAQTDTDGHGTFVAGVIASSGMNSPTGALGSVTGADFRGMAPAAEIYSMWWGFSDYDLQRSAAQTNALISNDSWTYGSGDYDIAAASYDAAVRDAVPGQSGPQPVLFVFPAGNKGRGSDNGTGGNEGSILSPGTAKNVITVGAIEQPRGITNEVAWNDGTTNHPWAGETDSSDQVAAFSSRGNVGRQVEGDFGRFKPDVVAPGVFVVSTRSTEWNEAGYYHPTNYTSNTQADRMVATNSLKLAQIFVPTNAVVLSIRASSVDPANVDLPIYVNPTTIPGTNDILGTNVVVLPPDRALDPVGRSWFYSIGNPTNVPVHYDLQTVIGVTNDNSDLLVLSNLNEGLKDYYRYESGTSISAAEVSGMLALMQEYFTKQGVTNSPALMKALVINGARAVNTLPGYDFQVRRDGPNLQGWGLVNLTNTLPVGLTNGWVLGQSQGAPAIIFDQSPTNALATGERRTVPVKVAEDALGEELRVTLVWTDPPGNPAAGVKLVNNLDLVVTNLDTGQVYYGNDFDSGSSYSTPAQTNNPPNPDVVNNVENVYLPPFAGTNFTVTVVGDAVNVNAVTTQTNNVSQDYALVISSGNGTVADALSLNQPATELAVNRPLVTTMTNMFDAVNQGVSGQLLLNQHVGADFQLLGTNTIGLNGQGEWGTNGAITLGVTNQWHFYVLTNDTAFTNVAFATFEPPDLSVARIGAANEDPNQATRPEADLDLYVSTDPGITNLNPAALNSADKALSREGTETIVYTNSTGGTVYYAAVKAEDQKAAEYGFLGLISEQPFSTQDKDGNVIVRGVPVNVPIPDGSPAAPGVARVFGIAVQPLDVRRVVVTNTITHENFGDLLGNLNHNRISVVLNNHSAGSGAYTQTRIYEDNNEGGASALSTHTDGPGSLTDYIGEKGQGLWLLSELDTAQNHVGEVNSLWLRLEPQTTTNGNEVELTVQANSFAFDYVDVPPEATNLTISVRNDSSNPLPLQLYVKYKKLPTLGDYDYVQNLTALGGSLTIDLSSLPPLKAGRYYIGIYNPNAVAQTVNLRWVLGLDLNGVATVNFSSSGPVPLLDDAVTDSSIYVSNDQRIVSVNVGVQIEHPRVSDLRLTLISPKGKRILLMENRGAGTTNGVGGGTAVTNLTTVWEDGFENGTPETYSAGMPFSGGWTISSGDINLLPTGFNGSRADTGNQYIDINGNAGSGSIYTNFTTVPGKKYQLTFAYARNPDSQQPAYNVVPLASVEINGLTIIRVSPNQANSWANLNWQHATVSFTATTPVTRLDLTGENPGPTGVLFDSLKIDQLAIQIPYFTFTEDTNLTQVPIKFAIPPFVGSASNSGSTNIFLSNFESATPGVYTNETVDGWGVSTSLVSVEFDPIVADADSNVLALADGTLSRTLPTVRGRITRWLFALGDRESPVGGGVRAVSTILPTAMILPLCRTWDFNPAKWELLFNMVRIPALSQFRPTQALQLPI